MDSTLEIDWQKGQESSTVVGTRLHSFCSVPIASLISFPLELLTPGIILEIRYFKYEERSNHV